MAEPQGCATAQEEEEQAVKPVNPASQGTRTCEVALMKCVKMGS